MPLTTKSVQKEGNVHHARVADRSKGRATRETLLSELKHKSYQQKLDPHLSLPIDERRDKEKHLRGLEHHRVQ